MSAVPKLRFSEFESDWKLEPIKNNFDLISGSHLSPNEYTSVRGQTPYFTGPSDYTNDETTLTKWSLVENKFAKAGDLLITVKGNGVGETLYLELSKVAMGRQLMAFESKQASPKFLDYVLQPMRNYLFALASGNMIPGLSRPDLLNLKVYFPSPKEQKKIADYLGTVDDKIGGLRERERLLTKYKKGVMQKIFTQTLRFKADDSSDFPDWEIVPMGELGTFMGGGTPSTEVESFWGGEIPWISSSDITESNIQNISITRHITEDALMASATKLVPENSILIVSRVGVGKFAVTKEALCTSQDFCNFTPYSDNLYFLAYWMLYNKNKLLSLSQGTSIKGFTTVELKAMKVEVPHPEEQQKIADFLAAIDVKITAVSDQITQMQDFKKGLLQQMFV